MLYALGAIPVALRAFVPEPVLDIGLFILAMGVAWLSAWLLRNKTVSGHEILALPIHGQLFSPGAGFLPLPSQ